MTESISKHIEWYKQYVPYHTFTDTDFQELLVLINKYFLQNHLCNNLSFEEYIENRKNISAAVVIGMFASPLDIFTTYILPLYLDNPEAIRSIVVQLTNSNLVAYFQNLFIDKDDSDLNLLQKNIVKEYSDTKEQLSPIRIADLVTYKRVCKNIFDLILKNMSQKKIPNSDLVRKAYETANDAHYGALRKSGEIYLIHPIIVAKYISDIGADAKVISAAILHDVVEDCKTKYPLERIQKMFGVTVANYVDAVTAVERITNGKIEKFKADLDSANKLLKMSIEKPSIAMAIDIKAADRLHNLRTLDCFSDEKIKSKVDETRFLFLPIFEAFGLNYFVPKIKNEMLKHEREDVYCAIKASYNECLNKNRNSISAIVDAINKVVENSIRFCDSNGNVKFDNEIIIEDVPPTTIYDSFIFDSKINSNSIKKDLPVKYVDIVLDSNDGKPDLSYFTVSFINNSADLFRDKELVIDQIIKSENNYQFIIEDQFRTKIKLTVWLKKDYLQYLFGSSIGINLEIFDYSNVETGKDTIKIKDKSGKERKLPAGSTVLDFALRLSEKVYRHASSAIVNGKKIGLGATLHQGDQVEILTSDKETICFSWLPDVTTKAALRALAQYFQDKYDVE